jgi:16S rRNA processing protein RimM
MVVEPLTDAPDAYFASGHRVFAGTVSGELAPDRRSLTIAAVRPFREGRLVTFHEITSRTDAEPWRDRYLLVPADEVVPIGEDEIYVHDLIGMRVEVAGGASIGEVVATLDLPQGLALEVARDGVSGTMLVPYRAEWVVEVDAEGKRIVFDPPEGLFD